MIFTDLSAASLKQWDQVLLYRSEAELSTARRHLIDEPPPLTSRLLWDGRLWEGRVEAGTVLLQPEIGAVLTLPSEHFQRLLEDQPLCSLSQSPPSPRSGEQSHQESNTHAHKKRTHANHVRLTPYEQRGRRREQEHRRDDTEQERTKVHA